MHLILAVFCIVISLSAGFASLNVSHVSNASASNETFVSRALLSTNDCQPGFGSTGRSTALCEMCAPGFYSRGGVGSKCLVCDQFSYAVSSGSSSCTQCPPNQWVGSKGSASPICVCMKNFYFAFYRDASLKGQMPPTPTDIAQTLSTFSTPSEKFCLPCPFGAPCCLHCSTYCTRYSELLHEADVVLVKTIKKSLCFHFDNDPNTDHNV